MNLIAYHADPAIKDRYLARMAAHRAADQLLQRYGYWRDGKGCAIGCCLHSNDHKAYERELGIPVELAHLEDWLFEALPLEKAKFWPERFLSAIVPGADLNRIYDLWSAWNLIDPTDGVITFVTDDYLDIQRIVRETAEACLAGNRISTVEAARAVWAAEAAEAAWARAAEAAWARAARAARAAEAAWGAAWAARTARAAEAAEAAEAARAARAAEAARSQYCERAANKLLELLASAPIAAAPPAKSAACDA